MGSIQHKSHKPRKRFGQNFLIDTGVIDQILAVVSPSSQDHMVEIGPGFGAITEQLLPAVAHLDAVELDRDLIATLTEKFTAANNFSLHNADILKFDLEALAKKLLKQNFIGNSLKANLTQHTPILDDLCIPHESRIAPKIRIVGNIPYNISTPLIFYLLDFAEYIADIHIMVQKEVAMRLASMHGVKTFGRLTVMVQHCCQVIPLFDIPPSAFDPPPAVNSAFIRIIPDPEKAARIQDLKLLRLVTTTAFNQRRKTILNALKSCLYAKASAKSPSRIDATSSTHNVGVSAELLVAAGIEPTMRPEQIAVESYIKLCNMMLRS